MPVPARNWLHDYLGGKSGLGPEYYHLTAAEYANAIAPAGPCPTYYPNDADTLASWPLDEPIGSVAFASAVNPGAATALAGSASLIMPGVTMAPWGKAGVAFSGTGGFLKGAPTVRPTGNAFTVSFWANLADSQLSGAGLYWISKFYAAEAWADPYTSFTLTMNAETLTLAKAIAATYSTAAIGSIGVIRNPWIFVVMSVSAGTMKTYINGSLVITTVLGGNIDWNTAVDTGSWVIGNGATFGVGIKHAMFDVRIHNVARDQAWVTDAFNTGMGY